MYVNLGQLLVSTGRCSDIRRVLLPLSARPLAPRINKTHLHIKMPATHLFVAWCVPAENGVNVRSTKGVVGKRLSGGLQNRKHTYRIRFTEPQRVPDASHTHNSRVHKNTQQLERRDGG